MLKYSVLSLIVITVLLGQQSNIANAQCESNPCLNGGVCNQDATLGIYWCSNCGNGCSGQNCESCPQNTLCASNPCQNGGVCNQDTDLGLYWCTCQSNCSGQNCESCTINACSSRPCKNGAACTPVGSIYQCSCRTGCYGSDCSVCYTTATTTTTTQTPVCSSSPCKNGGSCVQVGSSYQCYCPSNCQGYDCSYCSGTTAAPACADYNPSVCRNYAALGYCNLNAYINGALFKVSCPVSCNNCATTKATTTTKASCVDTQANCVYWANYCNLIPYPNPCPKTCKLC